LKKLIVTAGVVAVSALGAVSSASAAGTQHPQVGIKKCGTGTYAVACTSPKVSTSSSLKPGCVNSGTSVKLPTFSFTANAGIKKITVTITKRTLKTVSPKGEPTTYKLKNVAVPTVDLASGAHSVTVKVTDGKGKTASKTLHFSVCVAKPVFTG